MDPNRRDDRYEEQRRRRESNLNNEDEDPRLIRFPAVAKIMQNDAPHPIEDVLAYQRDFYILKRTGEHVGLGDRKNPSIPRQFACKMVTSYDQPRPWRKDPADDVESPQVGRGRDDRSQTCSVRTRSQMANNDAGTAHKSQPNSSKASSKQTGSTSRKK